MNKICIKDLNFRYDDKVIFNNFNLTLNKGLTFLIGNNGSGKSTLFNILSHKLPCVRNILVDDTMDLSKNNKNILFLDMDYVNKLNGKINEILDDKTIKYLDLNTYIDTDCGALPFCIKIKVCIGLIFVSNCDAIFIDDILCWLSKNDRNKILKKLKTVSKKKIILIITNNMEDTIFASRLILLDKGNIILDDKPIEFYKNEKVIKNFGISFPFMVDLSLNLMLYNTVDDIYIDMEKLVDNIWK